MGKSVSLRKLPSMTQLLESLEKESLPRPLVVAVARDVLAGLRRKKTASGFAAIASAVHEQLRVLEQSRLQPVINATGVLIHTNLGRAPLSKEVMRQVAECATQYNNLEFELTGGTRGQRGGYLEAGLATLCGAEASAAVNNCAAALVLVLRHLASGEKTEVIVSRGELVQIGGGFRIPDILESSGARLREVGTTNKTSLIDYARSISPKTALILKVHRSNFFMEGFVESPVFPELAQLASRKKIPLVEDLGSGALFRTDCISGLEAERTPDQSLKEGADLVLFSGDKLFGGPQAGIIAGSRRMIAGLKNEPFFRAVRCDKLVLAALQATVESYLTAPEPFKAGQVQLLEMISASTDVLEERARSILSNVGRIKEIELGFESSQARLGGGTLPRSSLPSVALSVRSAGKKAGEILSALRRNRPPIIGYIHRECVFLNLRTVFPEQDVLLIAALKALAD